MEKTFPNDGRDEAGRVKPGYALWRLREAHGRRALFEDGEQLWAACCNYFEATHNNPLYEEKAFSSGGEVIWASIPKMRAFTVKGLCVYLRISFETWRDWRQNRTDLKEVVETVDAIIYSQKFEGAAAGMLNANIIARDLGLTDKSEVAGKDGAPTYSKDTATIETARRIAFVLADGARLIADGQTSRDRLNQAD